MNPDEAAIMVWIIFAGIEIALFLLFSDQYKKKSKEGRFETVILLVAYSIIFSIVCLGVYHDDGNVTVDLFTIPFYALLTMVCIFEGLLIILFCIDYKKVSIGRWRFFNRKTDIIKDEAQLQRERRAGLHRSLF